MASDMTSDTTARPTPQGAEGPDSAERPDGTDRAATATGVDDLGFLWTPPPGGYIWWYVDALSDDGRYGLTIIAFIGSVFSPYYVWAGRRDPRDHCAINVALYDLAGRGRGDRWAMTERGAQSLTQRADGITVGPSALTWTGDTLTIEIDERAAPLPRRLKGTITVHAKALNPTAHALDAAARHHWRPIAPVARAEVAMTAPALAWSGHAYVDSNWGTEPLEKAFARWDWSRGQLGGDTVTLYAADRRDGTHNALGLRYHANGRVTEFEPPAEVALPVTGWRMHRRTRTDGGQPPHSIRTIDDSPFYTRSVLEAPLLGARVATVHESLNLDRFDTGLVRAMLPFRMPRKWWPR
ncbi:carotenoid 1,2-hydratase [Rhodothalassium salexigens]|uniref:carotenoid 1,2-hydratase n=1 Tax=Rhodothalassium salexigens TaxID=1086 RepID=UPI0019147FF4|nr:carotenoid 1,2-hydratase [Rhodothalassium salexigens]